MNTDFTRRQIILAGAGVLAGMPTTGTALAGSAASAPAHILIMGDSLSAEYGLSRGSGWAALLQAKLDAQHLSAQVINASITGETTAGGRTRLPALLAEHHPSHVVIELGANDALRGLSFKASHDNLQAMISACHHAGAKVLLVGMLVPPNYGKRYVEDFAKLYVALAQENKTALVPFLLKGVADRPDARDWFQADGIHPLAKAHPIMMGLVWDALKPLLLGHQAGA